MRTLILLVGPLLLAAMAWLFLNVTSSARQARGLEAFKDVLAVIQHPRCLNCHQSHMPRIRENGRPHVPRVRAGNLGVGLGGHRCSICHRDTNNAITKIPGAAGWRKPPYSMSWNGLEASDICENLKDKQMNGGRDLAGLLHHLENDTLVTWAWSPGEALQSAPSSHQRFVARAQVWIDAGAPCPAPSEE